MDIDTYSPRPRSRGVVENDNAQAGPSTHANPPRIFLQPPPERAPRRALLNSTDDLISRFQLLPAYDKYVRPYIHSQPTSELHAKSTPGALPFSGGVYAAPTPGAFDKGKGREILVGTPQTPAAAPTPAADAGEGGDGEEEEGAKGDKKKKNYRFLIKDIPGKHSMRKDDYLQSMMVVPPKQRMAITRFDQRTQREAFTVSLEGLKGWNINTLVTESAQAKEDRKKRKEAKRLAKAQALAAGVPSVASLASLPPGATGPTLTANGISVSSSSAPASALTPGVAGGGRIPPTPSSMTMGTPRPAPPVQRASSRPPGPGPGSGVGVNVTPVSGPSHPARPGTPSSAGATATTPRPRPSTPSIPNGINGPGSASAFKRGIKRDLEDDTPLAQVVANQKRAMPGSGQQQGALKNGLGVGPTRPIKKPRTDASTHNGMGLSTLKRELPQQQPTPQGV